jgi:UPF0716 protein FxsA
MFLWMIFLFTVLPALEIWVFFQIPMSLPAKLLVVLCTGVAGAALARAQGLRVVRQIQEQLAQGVMPAGELVEGGIVLFGGALLLTPGFITDTIGFLCLLPPTRKVIAVGLQRWFRGRIQVTGASGFTPGASFTAGGGFSARAGGALGAQARVRRPSPTPVPDPPPPPVGAPGRIDMGAHAGSRMRGPTTIDANFSVVDDDE